MISTTEYRTDVDGFIGKRNSLTIMACALLFVAGCSINVESPGSSSEDSIAMIRSSEKLNRLNTACEFESIFPRGSMLYIRLANSGDKIFKRYDVRLEFAEMKRRLNQELGPLGWVLKSEGSTFSEDQVEYIKDSFRLSVAKHKFDKSEYVLTCEDLTLQ